VTEVETAMELLALISIAFALQLAVAQNSTSNPIVDLGYVKYKGVYNASVEYARTIYALSHVKFQ
jgi:hypothetical protein